MPFPAAVADWNSAEAKLAPGSSEGAPNSLQSEVHPLTQVTDSKRLRHLSRTHETAPALGRLRGPHRHAMHSQPFGETTRGIAPDGPLSACPGQPENRASRIARQQAHPENSGFPNTKPLFQPVRDIRHSCQRRVNLGWPLRFRLVTNHHIIPITTSTVNAVPTPIPASSRFFLSSDADMPCPLRRARACSAPLTRTEVRTPS